MTKNELIALAEERGVEIDPRDKKAVIAEALGIDLGGEPDADEPDAVAEAPPALDPGMVKVRILPLGAGKVSNGKGGYKNEEGRIAYGKCAKGEELIVAQSVGEALEARGFAEVL